MAVNSIYIDLPHIQGWMRSTSVMSPEWRKAVKDFFQQEAAQRCLVSNDIDGLYKLVKPYMPVKPFTVTRVLLEAGIDVLACLHTVPERSFQMGLDDSQVCVGAQITALADMAFWQCNKLQKITFETDAQGGSSLQRIGMTALGSCFLIKELDLPQGVLYIGDNAFEWCGSLQKVKLPGSLRHLGHDIFWGCSKLEEITYEGLLQDFKKLLYDGALNDVPDQTEIVCLDITMTAEQLRKQL